MKKRGKVITNENERVCVLGALILQYTMLQDKPRVQDLIGQLQEEDRANLLQAAFEVCRHLSARLSLDVMSARADNKTQERENARLLNYNDRLTGILRSESIPFPVATDL